VEELIFIWKRLNEFNICKTTVKGLWNKFYN